MKLETMETKTVETDEPRWRESVRQQMESELTRRVREALETPPLERLQRRKEQARRSPDINAHLLLDLSERERDILTSRRWKTIQRYNSPRPSLHPASRVTNHSYDNDSDQQQQQPHRQQHRQHYLHQHQLQLHQQLKQHQQQLFNHSVDLATASKSERVRQMEFLFRDELSRSNHDEYPGVFGLGNLSEGIKNIREDYSVSISKYPGAKPKVRHFYTKEGFLKALRAGNLPAGVQFIDECGTYIDKYGVVRNKDGPFWPVECVPLFSTPRFKWWTALEPEPLYYHLPSNTRTIDNQITPFKGRWRGIQVAFDSERSSRDFSPLSVPEGCCPTLQFESRFECGNLRQARRVGQFEYELVLKSDLYTLRHTQWYYFRVSNVVPGITYKFRIVNLLKRDSLYNHGMRPLVYSEKEAQEKQRGWVRTGHHISYSRNYTNHNCPLLQRGITYHMLEWQMEFPNEDDTYYLAHCYPYSFTDLKEDLEVLMNSEERSEVTRREVMCETRAGNSCFLLTVTNFNIKEGKKAVVISARVHPGESQASWMMKGLLEFITGPDPVAQELRNQFVFKIVPMINPDGVIVGNYRCSLAARDLNRNYRHPRRENFPTIWYLKNMIEDLGKKHEICLYCDLHGHSRKPNVFMYGNNTSSEGDSSPLGMARAFISERLFPWLMAERSPDKFHFKSCKFNIRKCKESTGRVVMWRQHKIFNSFTLEATFSGTVLDKENYRHFNILDFMEMGKVLAQTVLDYQKVQESQAQQTQAVLNLTKVITEQILISKGLIEPDSSLPDFNLDKDMTESEHAKVKESAEKWTGALLSLLNTPREPTQIDDKTKQPQGQQAAEPVKAGAGDTGETEPDKPVYTREDVVRMLGSLSAGKDVEQCFGLLAQLDVQDAIQESDSSDSDSESEPEMKIPEPRTKKKKRKSKKQRDHDKKASSSTAAEKKQQPPQEERVKALSALPVMSSSSHAHHHGGSTSASAISDSGLGGHGRHQASSDKGRSRQVSGFISKYQGRTNGGVPCFTEERSMERAAKRMAELRKRHSDDRGKEMTFYCADDQGMSHEELIAQRLQELNEQSSGSPHLNASALLGNLNVRTSYTHADHLQDLSPSPSHQPNGVNSYFMSSIHTTSYHHHNNDPHEHSSSDASENDENNNTSSADNDKSNNNKNNNNNNNNSNQSNNDHKNDIEKKTNNSSNNEEKDKTNHDNSEGCNENKDKEDESHDKGNKTSRSKNSSSNKVKNRCVKKPKSASPEDSKNSKHEAEDQGSESEDDDFKNSEKLAILPLAARRNPYHNLDPLTPISSSVVTSNPNSIRYSHFLKRQGSSITGIPENDTVSGAMHNSKNSNSEVIGNPLASNSSQKLTALQSLTANNLELTLCKEASTNSLSNSLRLGASQPLPNTATTHSSSVLAFHPTATTTVAQTPALTQSPILAPSSDAAVASPKLLPDPKLLRELSNSFQSKKKNTHESVDVFKQLKAAQTKEQIAFQRYQQTYNNHVAINASKHDLYPSLYKGLSNDVNQVKPHLTDFSRELQGARLVPDHQGNQQTPRHVGQLVQQLAQNLSSLPGSGPSNKRHFRSHQFRSLSRNSPSLHSSSPLTASGLGPAHRASLPDHMLSPRIDDNKRLGLRASTNNMVRSLHQSPSSVNAYNWE